MVSKKKIFMPLWFCKKSIVRSINSILFRSWWWLKEIGSCWSGESRPWRRSRRGFLDKISSTLLLKGTSWNSECSSVWLTLSVTEDYYYCWGMFFLLLWDWVLFFCSQPIFFVYSSSKRIFIFDIANGFVMVSS